MKVSDPKCYRYVDLEKATAWQAIGNEEPMTIPVNGYLAVYLTNATSFADCEGCLNSEGDVYFDKLKIKFTRGNLKEETHYYPFGLPMAGMGSSAAGMTPNRQKYQSNEYITGGGLNWMDFHNRQYDPQLGRFLSVDPLAGWGDQDRFSPYAAMGDEPADMVDPLGLMDEDPKFEGQSVTPGTKSMVYIYAHPIIDPIAQAAFNAFWGQIGAGGFWGSPGGNRYGGGGGAAGGYGRGAYTSAVNSRGTLQSLSQSNEQGSGSTPAVADNNIDGENGYGSNYEGKTGGDGENKGLEAAERITEAVGVSYDATKEGVVAAQKLANKLAGTTNEILTGGELAEGLGKGLAGAGAALTIADGLSNGWENHHTADLGVDAAIYIISAEVPVAGWIVGGSYFIGNLIFEHYHNGQSITEYYLDN